MIICGTNHGVTEAKSGDGKLQRHVGLTVPKRIVLRSSKQDLVDDSRKGNSLQKIVDDEPLVMPLSQLSGSLEKLTIGSRATTVITRLVSFDPINDSVVEPQESKVELRDD